MEDRITDVTLRIRRGPLTRPMVVHVDRLWKYYGPGNFTWGGLAEAETSNHDDAELGSSSSVAMTDDEDLEEYIFEESPESAWVSIGSPLARREDTIDPRAGAAGGTNQGQETLGETIMFC